MIRSAVASEIRRIVEEAHQTAKDILVERREGMDRISKILLERETIDAEEFEKLLGGATEDEVFGEPEAEEQVPDQPEAEPERQPGLQGPRPLPRPRPGFAGGGADA